MKAEFVMLAQTYQPGKVFINGWFMSEKIDGQRAIWDGGLTRGVPKRDVPWANNDKDSRYQKPQIATGLWTRYGNVIHAPDNWLDHLPPMILDGELDCGNRQKLRTIVSTIEPGDWSDVTYRVFDKPSSEEWLAPRKINTTNFKKVITPEAWHWFKNRGQLFYDTRTPMFESLVILRRSLDKNPVASVLPQFDVSSPEAVEGYLDHIVTRGGEGVVLRNNSSVWKAIRSHSLLKYKKFDDAEGIVTGYVAGRETDKGSKLLGLMGALVLDYNGKRLEISGFTDEERVLSDSDYVARHPGEECPSFVTSSLFPIGSCVTFKFRGFSNEGVPQEARYWRKRNNI